jgi:hypothetical protein
MAIVRWQPFQDLTQKDVNRFSVKLFLAYLVRANPAHGPGPRLLTFMRRTPRWC